MKKASRILGALALALAVLTAGAVIRMKQQPPLVLGQPRQAMEQARTVMDRLCGGDYAGAALGMAGNPDLGADREPADAVGKLLWEAFLESLECEFQGQPYATDYGLAWDAQVTCLDFDSVTEKLGSRSRELLDQRVARAEDVSEIYDEQHEYREEVVMEVLAQAAQAAVREDGRTVTRPLTVQLTCADGQWWVVPDGELLNVFSWGTVGG